MGTIKSTYRFVPVNEGEKFFSPSWKNQVSMDIPFKNALSGTIKYSLKANTAIFVKGSDGNFCNHNGHYFIPGTTVKGCIRSVLEIMSCGHLGSSRVQNNDEPYQFRDIADQNGYMKKMKSVYCGWLSEDGSKLSNCGKPSKIKYHHIDRNFTDGSALEKYSKYKNLKRTFRFELRDIINKNGKFLGKQEWALPGGTQIGYIFFSGEIGTKKSDFVLKGSIAKDIFPVSKEVLGHFQEIYPDYRKLPYNKEMGGYPVFFTMENKIVSTIGLSYLHKYLVKNKIRQAIPTGLQNDKKDLDLADVMFGNTENYRGRIQFGPAKGLMDTCKPLIGENDSLVTVLGSPRASYYPTYLQDRKTWDSEHPIISGIKRYPIKPTYDASKLELLDKNKTLYEEKFGPLTGEVQQFVDAPLPLNEKGEYNFDTVVKLNPLKEEAEFSGYIHFFNLREEELGALLSALTFHGREDKCKHSIGQGKSLGYGSVSLTIGSIVVNGNDATKESYLDSFKNLMQKHDSDWEKSARLKELFAMAEGFSDAQMSYDFKSMMLEEFGKAKQQYMKFNKKDNCYGNDYLSYTETALLYKQDNQPRKSIINKPSLVTEKMVVVVAVCNKHAQQVIINNQKYPFTFGYSKERINTGDSIEVEVTKKNNKIQSVVFIKKVK